MMTLRSYRRRPAFTALISARDVAVLAVFDPAQVHHHVDLGGAVFYGVRRPRSIWAAVVEYPLGKPMTVQMGTRPPAYSAAWWNVGGGDTHRGGAVGDALVHDGFDLFPSGVLF